MGNFIDLSNKRFGRWIVLKRGNVKDRKTYWLCKCKCGTIKEVGSVLLRNDNSRSCGCLSKELVKTRFIKHGFVLNNKKDRFYTIWQGLKYRCLNRNTTRYKDYGGRGITICNRWHKFENFRDDMYKGYLQHCKIFGEKNTSIDRIDNNGNYELSNCKWSTPKEQNRNTRLNINIEYNGEIKCLMDWSEELKIKYGCLKGRLNRGWSIERTLTTPSKRNI